MKAGPKLWFLRVSNPQPSAPLSDVVTTKLTFRPRSLQIEYAVSVRNRVGTPRLQPLKATSSILSKKTQYSKGTSIQLCLVPDIIPNIYDSSKLSMSLPKIPSWNERMMLVKLAGQSTLNRLFHRTYLFMESMALTALWISCRGP